MATEKQKDIFNISILICLVISELFRAAVDLSLAYFVMNLLTGVSGIVVICVGGQRLMPPLFLYNCEDLDTNVPRGIVLAPLVLSVMDLQNHRVQ